MADLRTASWSRSLRADRILIAAMLGLCVTVILLLIAFTSTRNLHDHVYYIVQQARNSRAEVIEIIFAKNEATSAVYSFTGSRDPRFNAAYVGAVARARAHIEQLRDLADGDPTLTRMAERVAVLNEDHVRILDRLMAPDTPTATPAQIQSAFDRASQVRETLQHELSVLHVELNGRIDAARSAEDEARNRNGAIGVALAIFSILASALAVFALRRERGQWLAANAALEEAHAKAAQSDLAKTRFLAAASHDMRQPLHALTLYLSALRRRVDTDEARDIVDKMERATQSMVGMFSTLLDLARMQADVVKPDIIVFPLQDVLDRVIAQHPGARIAAFAAHAPLFVRSDPNLLERLLRNFVSNALKHGGGAALVEINEIHGEAEIAVVDRGPGIALEDQAKIFDEFVRLDGKVEGLGLGLSIVKRIADLLGAKVEVRSEPGAGAIFLVRVPIEASATPNASAAPPDLAALKGAPVLVMDDDPLALEAMAGALRDYGAEVRTAADEKDVAAHLRSGFHPCLLVMDLRIDGALEGINIAGRAANSLSPPPQVIMVTGDTGPETLAALRASGYAWLIKPVAPEDLARTLAAARTQTLAAV